MFTDAHGTYLLIPWYDLINTEHTDENIFRYLKFILIFSLQQEFAYLSI